MISIHYHHENDLKIPPFMIFFINNKTQQPRKPKSAKKRTRVTQNPNQVKTKEVKQTKKGE